MSTRPWLVPGAVVVVLHDYGNGDTSASANPHSEIVHDVTAAAFRTSDWYGNVTRWNLSSWRGDWFGYSHPVPTNGIRYVIHPDSARAQQIAAEEVNLAPDLAAMRDRADEVLARAESTLARQRALNSAQIAFRAWHADPANTDLLRKVATATKKARDLHTDTTPTTSTEES